MLPAGTVNTQHTMQATVIEDKPAKERVKFMMIYCIRPHRQIKFKNTNMTLIWSYDDSCMIRNGCWVRSLSIEDRKEESVECIHVTIRQDCLNIYQS